ncbi:hypothetical protein STENM327S_03914 [Streptomyces tendae]
MGTLIVTFVRLRQDMVGDSVDMGDWFFAFAAIGSSLGLTAPPLLLGLFVGQRRRLMESLRERADSLERELQLLAERAEERATVGTGPKRHAVDQTVQADQTDLAADDAAGGNRHDDRSARASSRAAERGLCRAGRAFPGSGAGASPERGTGGRGCC